MPETASKQWFIVHCCFMGSIAIQIIHVQICVQILKTHGLDRIGLKKPETQGKPYRVTDSYVDGCASSLITTDDTPYSAQ